MSAIGQTRDRCQVGRHYRQSEEHEDHGGEVRVADQPERTGRDESGALGLVDPDPPRSAHRQLRAKRAENAEHRR
jgi:hypothetical protein